MRSFLICTKYIINCSLLTSYTMFNYTRRMQRHIRTKLTDAPLAYSVYVSVKKTGAYLHMGVFRGVSEFTPQNKSLYIV